MVDCEYCGNTCVDRSGLANHQRTCVEYQDHRYTEIFQEGVDSVYDDYNRHKIKNDKQVETIKNENEAIKDRMDALELKLVRTRESKNLKIQDLKRKNGFWADHFVENTETIAKLQEENEQLMQRYTKQPYDKKSIDIYLICWTVFVITVLYTTILFISGAFDIVDTNTTWFNVDTTWFNVDTAWCNFLTLQAIF